MNPRAVLRRLRQAAYRLEDMGRRCRHYLTAPATDAELPASGYPAELTLLEPFDTLERQEPFRFRLLLRNRGTHGWSSRGRRPIDVRLRWLSRQGEDLGLEQSFALPVPLPPGAETILHGRLLAPESLGDYLLELDLFQEPDTRFQTRGVAPVRQPCRVTGRHADNIDYRAWYARQDLCRDYWTVVGPRSRAEYDKLGAIKRQLLCDLGLKPSSRVLDVGCGTGLLAAALEGFLDERGLYYGTDLAAEGVAFCRSRFRRPNFVFLQNEMTTLPLHRMAFDFVVFFSVFTHTYPNETALLLQEARRLLADDGLIFADLFTSPLVECYSGNRGAVEVNPDHFLQLVADAGLHAEVVRSDPWGACGQRVFFKMTAAAFG